MPVQPTLETLMQTHQLSALAPELVLALTAMAVLLAGVFLAESAKRIALPILAIGGCLITGFSTCMLWDRHLFFGPENSAIYSADNFALFFKFIFLLGLIVTILISGRFLSPREGDSHAVAGEYYALLMLSTVGMMMVAGARDLLIIFLGIETFSIALYILAGFARRNFKSNEASVKYFLLGAFASGFLLYGIALVYFSTGSTLMPVIAKYLAGRGISDLAPLGSLSSATFYLGLAFMLIGLGFKASLVPFHQWTPDVYEGAPTPVTAFMVNGAKAAAFAALIRVFAVTFGEGEISTQWHFLMLVMAVLTMTIGNVVALAQSSLKRMLAYSSIAHAGYILIGVIATGAAVRNANLPGMEDAAARANGGVLFYLLIYALMNLGAFSVLIYLENRRAEQVAAGAKLEGEPGNLSISDIRGLAGKEPLAVAALTLFLFSLAGVPPTAGFFGKFYIFIEAMQQGLIGLLIVGVINAVISVYYYLRPVFSMYSTDGETVADSLQVEPGGTATVAGKRSVSLGVVLAIALCAVGVLGMIVLQYFAMPYIINAASIFAS